MVFDTGSDWLVLESSRCSNCQGTNFDTQLSKGFKARIDNVEKKEYGSAMLSGVIAKDMVCLADGEFCKHDMVWFLIVE